MTEIGQSTMHLEVSLSGNPGAFGGVGSLAVQFEIEATACAATIEATLANLCIQDQEIDQMSIAIWVNKIMVCSKRPKSIYCHNSFYFIWWLCLQPLEGVRVTNRID